MELQPLAASAFPSLREQRSLEMLLRAIWFAACGLLLLLCAFLALRRASGGLQQPLPSVHLLVVGLTAGLTASGLRLLAVTVPATSASRGVRWARHVPLSLSLLCLAVALTLPGSSSWALAVFWGVLVLEEAAWWYAGLRPMRRPHAGPPPDGGAGAGHEAPPADRNTTGIPHALPLEAATDGAVILAPEMTQHTTRSRTPGGGETISGLVRGDFQPGERTQNLHISFCPPLASRPDLEAHQVEGPTAKIKAAQVESYGARLELRLTSRISHPESVVVRFDATLPDASHS
ncbi:MAG: hypothetical protein ACC628_16525 [Pirellulaceae bacterium]